MDPATILHRLHTAGVSLSLRGDRLSASPADRLDDGMRQLIRDHKSALVEFLTEAHQTTADLLHAAQAACDHWGDGPEAREQMRQELAEVPPHLRADLLAHFKSTYPRASE